MVDALPKLHAELANGDERFPAICCGIGLASGPCVVGNLGSRLRFDYSALGDDVNLASRLEGLTKMYGLDILATEQTRQMIPGLAWLPVDTVVVAGRSTPTRLVALLGDEVVAQSKSFRDLLEAHAAMLAVVQNGEFEAAAAAIRMLRAIAPPSLSAMYDYLEQDCRSRAALPAEERTRVTRLAHK